MNGRKLCVLAVSWPHSGANMAPESSTFVEHCGYGAIFGSRRLDNDRNFASITLKRG